MSPVATEVKTAFQKFYYVQNGVNDQLVLENKIFYNPYGKGECALQALSY